MHSPDHSSDTRQPAALTPERADACLRWWGSFATLSALTSVPGINLLAYDLQTQGIVVDFGSAILATLATFIVACGFASAISTLTSRGFRLRHARYIAHILGVATIGGPVVYILAFAADLIARAAPSAGVGAVVLISAALTGVVYGALLLRVVLPVFDTAPDTTPRPAPM